MLVDAIASHPHFVDHLNPVWNALPPEHRGVFTCNREAAAARARTLSLDHDTRVTRGDRLTLVASHADYQVARGASRPTAYLNHGVGQSWRDPAGALIKTGCGEPRPHVAVFLTPGPHATSVTREANGPGANIVEVGSPKVEALRALPKPTRPLLVFSTHWDHTVVPEARSALAWYWPEVARIARRLPVAVHAHPRARDQWARLAAQAGLEFIETFDQVCQRATVYASDASSTLFEFAALDRPVIVLNGARYRRDHRHGLRFWEAATVGVNVDHPRELVPAIRAAIADPPRQRRARREAVAMAYREFDKHAAERAAAALLEAAARLAQATAA